MSVERDICPGMRAHIAEVATFYAGLAEDAPMSQQRAAYNAMCRHFSSARPEGMRVEDRVVDCAEHRVPVRVFRPAAAGEKAGPCILFFHGGGFALGGLDSHESTAMTLAERASAMTVSIDYRLAPEHVFPAAFDDSFGVYRSVVGDGSAWGIDAERVVVCGDSAGANLAAAVAIAARDQRLTMPVGQVLIYPVLGADFETASYMENATAPMLTRDAMIQFWRQYAADEKDDTNPRAVPLAATDFTGLPSAFISTAQYDPVRDDGAKFRDALEVAGVPVSYVCARDLAHGYLRAIKDSPAAAREFHSICEAARRFAHGIDAERT